MQDVKIIDIDNEQWNMKDQEARNKIANLETKTTVKITEKVNKTNFKMNLVEINGEKFLQLHFTGLDWSGNIGETLATFESDFGINIVVRCLVSMDFTDGTGRGIANLDILEYGEIKIAPSPSNQTTGFYRPCKIYGDAFIKV